MRFSPGCTCCGSTPPCPKCATDSDVMPVTFDGFTDARCYCGFLNETTFLTVRGGSECMDSVCCWHIEGIETCEYYSSETHYSIWATVQDIGSPIIRLNVELQLSVYVSMALWTVTKTIWRLDVNSAVPIDCTATRSLPFNQYQTYPWGTRHACSNHSATTCQLN